MTVNLLGYLILVSMARFLTILFVPFPFPLKLVLISVQTTDENLKTAFNRVSNTLKFVKNTPLRVVICNISRVSAAVFFTRNRAFHR